MKKSSAKDLTSPRNRSWWVYKENDRFWTNDIQ